MCGRRLTFATVIFLIFITALTVGSARAGDMIRISSGSLTGQMYPMMTFIGERILKPEGFEYSNRPGGGVSNVLAVGSGKADLGVTMATALDMAENAQGPFKTKIEGNVLLAALYSARFQLVATKSSGIKDVLGLAGKRVGLAKRGQFSEIVFYDVIKAYGIKKEQMTLRQGSQSEGKALMKDRHLDAWNYFSPITNRHIQEMMLFLPMRLLSIPDEYVRKIAKMRKGYGPIMIPKGTYPSQDYDVHTIGSPMGLIVQKKMPEDIAYRITAALVKHIDILKDARGTALKDITPAKLADVGSSELHPGAERFYREKGILK